MPDFWNSVGRGLKRLEGAGGQDRSFAEFLRTRPGGKSLAQARTNALRFVQGFHAADADRISALALSYAVVGGSKAGARLARPAQRTLFYAGEATAGEHSGTVEGALRQGRRAALAIDRALG